jgi:hypothetical protein
MPNSAPSPRPLNPRQRRFVEEYRRLGNGTQAAIRAGYYHRYAAGTAWELLKRPAVQAALAEPPAPDAAAPPCVGDDPALRELSHLAYANLLDFTRRRHDGTLDIDWSRMTRAHAAAIRELVVEETRTRNGTRRTLRIRMADKQAALQRLIALSRAPVMAPGRPDDIRRPDGGDPDAIPISSG